MRLDEALELLGVDRETDVKTARRAYLRLLKKHKPERDPEGFKRVRAAWETVEAFLSGHGVAVAVDGAVIRWPPPPAPRRRPSPAPPPEPPRSDADDAPPEPDPVEAPDAAPAEDDRTELDPWMALDAAQASGDPRAELAAIEALADDPAVAQDLAPALVLGVAWKLVRKGDPVRARRANRVLVELMALRGGPLKTLNEAQRLEALFLAEVTDVQPLLPPATVGPLVDLVTGAQADPGVVVAIVRKLSYKERLGARRIRDHLEQRAPMVAQVMAEGFAALPARRMSAAEPAIPAMDEEAAARERAESAIAWSIFLAVSFFFILILGPNP